MKQSAVEWLYERLERMIPRTALYNIDKKEYFEQAKEMEKQQQGYSEEEVKNIVDETIEKFYKHFYTLTKAEMKEQWFEQFKKK